MGTIREPDFFLPVLALFATFVLAAWYVTNLGLLLSLRSQTTLRAMGVTLAVFFFTGGGYLLCCCVIMIGGTGALGGNEGIILTPCIPFLLFFRQWGACDTTAPAYGKN